VGVGVKVGVGVCGSYSLVCKLLYAWWGVEPPRSWVTALLEVRV
jgi:hypothetical protein